MPAERCFFVMTLCRFNGRQDCRIHLEQMNATQTPCAMCRHGNQSSPSPPKQKWCHWHAPGQSFRQVNAVRSNPVGQPPIPGNEKRNTTRPANPGGESGECFTILGVVVAKDQTPGRRDNPGNGHRVRQPMVIGHDQDIWQMGVLCIFVSPTMLC